MHTSHVWSFHQTLQSRPCNVFHGDTSTSPRLVLRSVATDLVRQCRADNRNKSFTLTVVYGGDLFWDHAVVSRGTGQL